MEARTFAEMTMNYLRSLEALVSSLPIGSVGWVSIYLQAEAKRTRDIISPN